MLTALLSLCFPCLTITSSVLLLHFFARTRSPPGTNATSSVCRRLQPAMIAVSVIPRPEQTKLLLRVRFSWSRLEVYCLLDDSCCVPIGCCCIFFFWGSFVSLNFFHRFVDSPTNRDLIGAMLFSDPGCAGSSVARTYQRPLPYGIRRDMGCSIR